MNRHCAKLCLTKFWRRGISLKPPCYDSMDPMEHATGIEKRELEAKAAGNDDPFGIMNVLKRGPGTKDNPTMIPSVFEGRIVGCICEGDRFAKWMWLEKGEPKRCECGHWFQLKEVKPL